MPTVVIRRHRLSIDSLDAWVDRDCMSPACADFLAAAVRAGWSTVVAGPMSAGKTTLMRALCAQIPPQEAIGTFETEYELFLAEAGRHEVVIDWESRPGMGEIGADGRAAGAFDLDDALVDSFRFALDRQIVGEIRGREVWTMIKAMESGTGSLSTTHASSAEACVHKLVTCAMETGGHVTRDLAMEKLAGCLDVIVQLDRKAVVMPDGTRAMRRWVREVAVVEPGRAGERLRPDVPVRALGHGPGAGNRDAHRSMPGLGRPRVRPGRLPGRGRWWVVAMNGAVLAGVFGAMVVAGLLGAGWALVARPSGETVRRTPWRPPALLRRLPRRTVLLLTASIAAGLVLSVVTGWLVAVLVVPAAALGLPYLLSAPPAADDDPTSRGDGGVDPKPRRGARRGGRARAGDRCDAAVDPGGDPARGQPAWSLACARGGTPRRH